jgi:hypothetical protein
MPSEFLISYFTLWAIVAVQFVALFALYHHFGEMYLNSREGREDQGPAVATSLKPAQLRDIQDRTIALSFQNSPSLIVFASTTCNICDRLRAVLTKFQQNHTDILTTVICEGETLAVQRWAVGLSDAVRVVADPGHQTAARYGVGLIPFAVAVDSEGVVRAKSIVNDRSGLEWVAGQLTSTNDTEESIENSGEIIHVEATAQMGSKRG